MENRIDDLLSILKIIWLDIDDGWHKKICEHTIFPNAKIINMDRFFPDLNKSQDGIEIINKLNLLKTLKGVLL